MKTYKLERRKYIGNHPEGRDTTYHSDVAQFARDSGANDDEIFYVFNGMSRGERIKISGKMYECTKHSYSGRTSFTVDEVVIIREVV
jgi:hypothetical protein